MSDPKLNGYNELVAITQNTINSQFMLLCPSDNSGPIHTQWQIIDPNDPRQQQGLIVTGMQPPTISVVQPDGSFVVNTLAMSIRLTSGTLNYYDYGQIASVPIKGWKITFRCPIGQMQLQGTQDLAKIAAPAATVDALTGYLGANAFSVAALFAIFERAAIQAAEVEIDGATALSPSQQGVLLSMLDAYLESLQSSATPFVLGYAAQSNDANNTLPELPMFAPTSCEFSDTPNPYNFQAGNSTSTLGLSTFNYLMMTGKRSFPASASRQTFNLNWVPENQYQGAFAIDATLFRSGYIESLLLPILRQNLGIPSSIQWIHNNPSYVAQAYGGDDYYTLSYSWVQHDNENDGKGHSHAADGNTVYEKDYFTTNCLVKIAPGPGPVTFTGGGCFYAKADFHAYTFGIANNVGWASAQVNYTFTMTLATGADGAATCTCDFTVDQEPTTDGDEDLLYKGIDWLVGLFNGDTLKDHLASAQSGISTSLQGAADAMAQNTSSALSKLAGTILLPNGSVFFYKDLAFDDQQNVVMYTTYKN